MFAVREFTELSEVKELLRALYAARGPLDLYTMHVNYRLSPGQVSRAARLLFENGLVADVDGGLVLTDGGRRWLLVNRRRVFAANPYWKQVPKELQRGGYSIPTGKRKLKLRPSDLRSLGIVKTKG